jgi:hypothetical protein
MRASPSSIMNWNSTRGSETLTVLTDEQGTSGCGGALTGSDTVG